MINGFLRAHIWSTRGCPSLAIWVLNFTFMSYCALIVKYTQVYIKNTLQKQSVMYVKVNS